MRFVEITAGEIFTIAGVAGGDLEITPVPVNHIVPTVGLLIRQGQSSFGFTSDTGPTEEFWERANQTENLGAIITECSFPNRLQDVADISLHLTPATLAEELEKLNTGPRVLLYHLKPPYLDEIRAELRTAPFSHPVEELEQDRVYDF